MVVRDGVIEHVYVYVLPDGTIIEYLIDGRDRRVGKKNDGELQKTWIYREQLSPVAQFDGEGNLTHRFVYAEKAHSPSWMVTIDPVTGEETVYRIIADHLGSIRLVIEAETGVTAQRIDYGPFGEVLFDSNPGFQPFGFAGGIYDRDSGLVRFGARDYDPEIGRWTAKDPIDFGGGDPNLCGYALVDPVSWIDPDGTRVVRPIPNPHSRTNQPMSRHNVQQKYGSPFPRKSVRLEPINISRNRLVENAFLYFEIALDDICNIIPAACIDISRFQCTQILCLEDNMGGARSCAVSESGQLRLTGRPTLTRCYCIH